MVQIDRNMPKLSWIWCQSSCDGNLYFRHCFLNIGKFGYDMFTYTLTRTLYVYHSSIFFSLHMYYSMIVLYVQVQRNIIHLLPSLITCMMVNIFIVVNIHIVFEKYNTQDLSFCDLVTCNIPQNPAGPIGLNCMIKSCHVFSKMIRSLMMWSNSYFIVILFSSTFIQWCIEYYTESVSYTHLTLPTKRIV